MAEFHHSNCGDRDADGAPNTMRFRAFGETTLKPKTYSVGGLIQNNFKAKTHKAGIQCSTGFGNGVNNGVNDFTHTHTHTHTHTPS